MRLRFNRNTLVVIGSLAAMGAAYTTYASYKGRHQDRLAAALLKELRKKFNPGIYGLSAEAAFDLDYKDRVLRKVSGQVAILSSDEALKKAQSIHSSFAHWLRGGDDEDRIYGVFRSLDDKVQVSQVAQAYYRKYHVNLIDKLEDKLTEEEINIILEIVKNLNPYTRKQ